VQHIYYLTRPDFLKHDHIHRRKIDALRASGLKASLIAFVPEEQLQRRREDYERAASNDARRIVHARKADEVNRQVWRFFAFRLFCFRRVLVHILLCDPAPLLNLKRMPLLGRRLKCIIEHEGDIASECLYRWAYGKVEPPPDEPPAEFRAEYDYVVAKQKAELLEADGAILVTKEHLALWEGRLGTRLNALVLPTMFDSAKFSFDAAGRQSLRSELGLANKLVLVYSGSVSMPWQRFEQVCQFTRHLLAMGYPACLLALVHPDGHSLAQKVIAQHGLESATVLRGVAPGEMAAWLSAADVALFLRHNHRMNRIVTSAKLGEYLAAGLPLVTTWACPYFRPFAETHSAALAVLDSLELPSEFKGQLDVLLAKGRDTAWRSQFSAAFKAAFSGANDPMNDYVKFMTDKLR
jgi:glycosyltransferase involved in cell wall biosynthesis